MVTVDKTISINAPKEVVWRVVTEQPYLNTWLNELLPGSKAEGETLQDGEILFLLDEARNGLKGTFTKVAPNDEYRIDFTEELVKGDVTDTPSSPLIGAWERYTLTETSNGVDLRIENAVPNEEMAQEFMAPWDKALAKIKSLAEEA